MQPITKLILLILMIVLAEIFSASTIMAVFDQGKSGGDDGSGYVQIGINESSKNIIVGQEILIQAMVRAGSGSYVGGCKIEFGDGQEVSEFCKNLNPGQYCDKKTRHSYDSPGNYIVKVRCNSSARTFFEDKEIINVSKELEPSNFDDDFNPLETKTLEGIVDSLAGLVFTILGGLGVLLIMIGGFYVMTAGGNPEQFEKGKKIILFTIVGLSIVIAAAGIKSLIYKILEIDL